MIEINIRRLTILSSFILMFTLFGAFQVTNAYAAQANYDDVVSSFWSPDTSWANLATDPGSNAQQMKSQIKQLVDEGKSKQEIIDYFVGIYGVKILAEPPKKGFFLSAWIMPIVGILIGIAMFYYFLNKRKKMLVSNKQSVVLNSDISDSEIDEEMKKYL